MEDRVRISMRYRSMVKTKKPLGHFGILRRINL